MTTRTAPAPIFEDVAAATPVQIDEQLARLGGEAASLEAAIANCQRKIARLHEMSPAERSFYAGTNEAEQNALIEQAEVRLTEIRFHFVSLNAEYMRRGGWRRYYLVEDGHLHYDVSGSRCSRVHSTTHYWMTEFSGQEPAKVIAQAGERVCTTCFPEAPVAPRPAAARFMTRTEAERAAYVEEKARKAAAKKAAQITTPEGDELIVGNRHDHIKTERAAWNRAMADATTLAYYGNENADDEHAAIDACLAALAHRRGVTVESLRAELNQKIAAKGRREGFRVRATA